MEDFELLKNKKVGFIGGGNMALAIGLGLVKKGVLNPRNIWVSSRTDKTLNPWKQNGVNVTFHNYEVVEKCDIVFLAVKPQMLDNALETCNQKPVIQEKLFISVILGFTLKCLDNKLRDVGIDVRLVRSMPNTPMMVAEGITAYCSLRTKNEDENIVKLLFSQLGICEKIPESVMNCSGALSGSGPAYAYMVIEALADGAVRKGLPRDLATRFAAQVLVGAGKMVLETKKHPGLLKDEVTSPGGSTITGVHELERGGVRAAMMNAIEAAANRTDEVSRMLNKH